MALYDLGALVVTHAMLRRLTSWRCIIITIICAEITPTNSALLRVKINHALFACRRRNCIVRVCLFVERCWRWLLRADKCRQISGITDRARTQSSRLTGVTAAPVISDECCCVCRRLNGRGSTCHARYTDTHTQRDQRPPTLDTAELYGARLRRVWPVRNPRWCSTSRAGSSVIRQTGAPDPDDDDAIASRRLRRWWNWNAINARSYRPGVAGRPASQRWPVHHYRYRGDIVFIGGCFTFLVDARWTLRTRVSAPDANDNVSSVRRGRLDAAMRCKSDRSDLTAFHMFHITRPT